MEQTTNRIPPCPTLQEWREAGTTPKLTNETYNWRDFAFSQYEIARTALVLTNHYIDWRSGHPRPKTPEDSLNILSLEATFYRLAGEEAGVPTDFAKSVAHWVGIYIDEYHDTNPEACGFANWDAPEKRTWEAAMEWAYGMLTFGVVGAYAPIPEV